MIIERKEKMIHEFVVAVEPDDVKRDTWLVSVSSNYNRYIPYRGVSQEEAKRVREIIRTSFEFGMNAAHGLMFQQAYQFHIDVKCKF